MHFSIQFFCTQYWFKSSFTMIVEYQWVLVGTFTLNYFLAVDLWKVFKKIKLVFGPIFWYLVPHFGSTG